MKRIYRIVALMMALLMFVTSTGFAVDMHYCQGQLKTFALIGEAKSCHEVTNPAKVCHHHAQVQQDNDSAPQQTNDCCNNIKYVVQSDLDKQTQSIHLSLIKDIEHFMMSFVLVFAGLDVLQTATTDYLNYKPPLLQRDLPVQLQTFLL